MIAYKYKIQNKINLSEYTKQYSSVIRYAYNRFREMPDASIDQVVRVVQQNMNNIDKLDFSLIRYAVLKAAKLKNTSKVIFGRRKNFKLLKYHNKIDKEKE